MPDRGQLETDILQFVRSRCARADVTAQTDMLDTGLLDSLLLVDLIFRIEERYGVRFESEHVSPANFRTVAQIVDLVMGQRQTGGGPGAAGLASPAGETMPP